MVDFNNEGTMSKPPREVVALIIIEKLYNFLEADEHYIKQLLNGAKQRLSVPTSRLRSLFLISQPLLKRRLSAEDYKEVKRVCCDWEVEVDLEKLLEIFFKIIEVLDKIGLTKLDTQPTYRRHIIEEANRVHGYG